MKKWKADMLKARAESPPGDTKPGAVDVGMAIDGKKNRRISERAPLNYAQEFYLAEMDSEIPFIDLHGMTREIAWQKVTDFLEDQQAQGIGAVKIIHGYGTGVLRAMLEKNLSALTYVKSFRDSSRARERGGAVIVLLYE